MSTTSGQRRFRVRQLLAGLPPLEPEVELEPELVQEELVPEPTSAGHSTTPVAGAGTSVRPARDQHYRELIEEAGWEIRREPGPAGASYFAAKLGIPELGTRHFEFGPDLEALYRRIESRTRPVTRKPQSVTTAPDAINDSGLEEDHG